MSAALTEVAIVSCDHLAGVSPQRASASFVQIAGVPMLRFPDPVGRPIFGCPNVGPTIKPCTSTLMMQVGQSSFVTIEGQPVALDTTEGLTDGTPPGLVKYKVRHAGQAFVTLGE